MRRAICAAMLVVLAGCSAAPAEAPDGRPAAAASFAVSPADGAEKVAPDKPVTVSLKNGKISKVVVADAKGKAAPGALSDDGRSWRTKWALKPGTGYTVTATGTSTDGKTVSLKSGFTTLKAKRKLKSGMSPLPGETVGVGMPIQLLLSHPIKAKKHKAAIERSVELRMSEPVEGAWHWMSDKEVQFRPREYWPSGEKVEVVAHLAGVRAGGGRWGVADRTTEFKVGPRQITKINAKKHKATVTRDGKTLKKIPVSLGKKGTESYSGTMIAQEKNASIVMDSATIGSPGEYRIRTKWNVRMTYSGTFFHSAPWSVGSQGDSNVSHGCVNASPGNAKWFFNFTNRGDIIEVKGTSKKVPFGSGPTPWVKSWEDWLAGSALGKPVEGVPLES